MDNYIGLPMLTFMDKQLNDFIDASIELDEITEPEEIHHELFNTHYWVIGRYKAIKILGDKVFDVIEYVMAYEQFNFGENTTEIHEPEKLVNMFVYIRGEELLIERGLI